MLHQNTSGDESPSPPIPPPREPSVLESVFLDTQGIRPGWRAAFYVALFMLFIMAGIGFSTLLLGPPPAATGRVPPEILFRNELIAVTCALAAAAVMSRLEGRPFGDYGTPWRSAFGRLFWEGAAWGFAQISVLVLLIFALGGYSFGELALSGAGLLRYAVLWAGAFFLVSLFEEFLFRGYLQFTLTAAMRFWPAAAFTSVGFGLIHLRNPGENPMGAASVFLVGMFLCLTLRRTGNLWFAVGWHAAFNFGQSYIYSLPNSGIVMQGQLLAADLQGPEWLTGGSVGPEGSILAFVTLGVAALAFDRMYRQPRPSEPPG
jgi:membrane protease YdiL (CAAX protease family)